MSDDKATNDKVTNEKHIDLAVAAFQKIADQRARDRRERIAMVVLAGGVSHPNSAGGIDCVKWAINLADELIRELDKEGGR